MSGGFDFYVRWAEKALSYLVRYRETAEKVKQVVKKFYPDARVYVFGSVVRGNFTAASDIDVLVVVPNQLGLEERAWLRAEVFKALPHAPIELHFADTRQFSEWYSRFIPREELVEV